MNLDPHDPRPLLAVLAALVLVAIDRSLSQLHPAALLTYAAPAAAIALGATAIASALATQRLLTTRRALRRRRALAVVPADEFKASAETVLRVAGQLARAERGVRGWLDRRACAIRVQLTNDAEGSLLYLLEVPERSQQVLRAALRAYQGVELRDPAEAPDGRPEPGKVVLRTELVLARPSVEPLARLSLDPDPLAPFAAAFAELRRGEQASVCVDLLPAAGRRRARLRGRLRRQARREHGERGSLWERLGGERGRRGRAGTDELVERRAVARALDAKLRDSGPLFEAQVLLCVRAAERERAKGLMRLLLAAFEPLADRNWLRPSGLPIPGLAFLGSDLPLRRRRFQRRLETGYFRPARRMILGAAELAGFLKPPSAECLPENVLRSGALVPAPPALPAFDPKRADLIPFGKVRGEGGERVVGVRCADTFHVYLAGRSRYGKTELAVAMFAHLVRSGQGGFFLDPHGDGIRRLAPYLAEPEVASRVVRIDLGPGGPEEQPGWNLFALKGGEREERVAAIVDAFATAMGWGESSTRAINLTTQAASALSHLAAVLPPELAPTIFQIPTLLANERWRGAALPFLPKAERDFWTERFPRLSEEAITPITNLIDRLRGSRRLTALLGQSLPTYSAREAMDEGLIVLANPGAGGPSERLLANLLVFDQLHTARGRGELEAGERRAFWLCLDEVQTFDSAAGSLAGLLEQSAKFGLHCIAANQNPDRLSPQTLNALTTNRSHLAATALNSHAAALIAREWGRRVDPEALVGLERFRFIAQVTDRGRLSKPFALGGITVEDALGPEPAGDPASGEASGAFGARRSAAEVIAHLERLDQWIATELRRRARGGGAPAPREGGGGSAEGQSGSSSLAVEEEGEEG